MRQRATLPGQRANGSCARAHTRVPYFVRPRVAALRSAGVERDLTPYGLPFRAPPLRRGSAPARPRRFAAVLVSRYLGPRGTPAPNFGVILLGQKNSYYSKSWGSPRAYSSGPPEFHQRMSGKRRRRILDPRAEQSTVHTNTHTRMIAWGADKHTQTTR